jgi:flagellar hook assembly protein FlgD
MNTRMSSKLEQLTDQQRFGSAAALIGRRVKGTTKDADGNEYAMEGTVVGIRFTESGEVMLDLDTGDTLPLTALQTVTNPASTTTSGTSQNTTTARIIK